MCFVIPSAQSIVSANKTLQTIQPEVVYTVAQLVEALCYKAEGRGFDSRWCHWNFSWK
jgi:hypothetical protein